MSLKHLYEGLVMHKFIYFLFRRDILYDGCILHDCNNIVIFVITYKILWTHQYSKKVCKFLRKCLDRICMPAAGTIWTCATTLLEWGHLEHGFQTHSSFSLLPFSTFLLHPPLPVMLHHFHNDTNSGKYFLSNVNFLRQILCVANLVKCSLAQEKLCSRTHDYHAHLHDRFVIHFQHGLPRFSSLHKVIWIY